MKIAFLNTFNNFLKLLPAERQYGHGLKGLRRKRLSLNPQFCHKCILWPSFLFTCV